MLYERPTKSQETAPDFRHVEAWIFDLDNTLYPASSDLFAQIDAKMTNYVQALLGLGWDDARALQKAYYRDHGTTLNGLMQNHGVEPDEFLGAVHDIDLAALMPDADLKAAIARLPGRRFIFTNGCRDHAARVLKQLQIETLFDAIWDIRSLDYCPKPDAQGYRRMLDDHGVDPARAAMFEDFCAQPRARARTRPHDRLAEERFGVVQARPRASEARSQAHPLRDRRSRPLPSHDQDLT